MLSELRGMISQLDDRSSPRVAVKNAYAPGVPFLGWYLSDLTFAAAGLPETRSSPMDKSWPLINFARYIKFSDILAGE